MPKTAIIIGAGPAGLTAAYELLKRTDVTPIILEKSGDIGGISKTINYKGNRMDIGGHRFFSKSDRVMQWWLNILPIQPQNEQEVTFTYHRQSKTLQTDDLSTANADGPNSDKVMLIRRRLSRIYFLRKFFVYPIQLSLDTLKKLGIIRTIAILLSYLKSRAFPRKPEKSLEDFFINRFGKTLYLLFFKDYTEKVWGVPCTKISAEWGAQRIKGISIAKALQHAIKTLKPSKVKTDIGQKGTETSLIEQFLYPKFGPGQLWEEVARQVQAMGGTIIMNKDVNTVIADPDTHVVTAIEASDSMTGEVSVHKGDYFFSTMPVQELVADMGSHVPVNIREIAAGLQYRDFITVGILLRKMPELPDTWIYIQERDVKVGRLQIFNNWSPFMVADPDTVWLGMEYFCNIKDDFWALSDNEIKAVAISELDKIGLAKTEDVLDCLVLRVEKTYPAYFGTYSQFGEIRQYIDQYSNLFLVGRNGMHKYNNSDHSMLTAMVAVDNIEAGISEKANIWSINTEVEYHEEKAKSHGHVEKKSELASLPRVAAFSCTTETFNQFLFKNKWNRTLLWIAGIAIIIQFLIFKHFYPYAGFINGDSYVYLQTAFYNSDINTYPIGYSRFLRLFSSFTTSDFALVAFQYLMLQASALFFVFSIFYYYLPGKVVQGILFIFIVCNPIFLYLANYVLSDALFIPLSITWFTLLLWILQRPTTRLLILQCIVLFIAFTVRYNALFYPILGFFGIFLSRQKMGLKLAGMLGSILLIAGFVEFTSAKYKDLAGVREFSPFSGWQIANNAMYAYRYVDSQHVKPVPPRFRQLDHMVRTYFDTTRDARKHPQEMLIASTVYMWDPSSPLQIYMNDQFKKDSTFHPLKRWATMGPLYEDYGDWLIRTYPATFAEHYLLPNALKYYAPPVEFLDTYNMGKDSVGQIAQIWFHWKDPKVKTLLKDFNVRSLNFYPILVGVLNVVFLLSFLFYLILNGLSRKVLSNKVMWLTVGLWIINFSFSVFASPIALRFQIFPVIVFITISFLLLENIWKTAFAKQAPALS